MNQSNVLSYYNAICKDLKIEPTKIVFTNVARGGACIVHSNGIVKCIQIDLKRCYDIERGVLHEVAHKILIRKNNNFSHNTTFKKLENKLIDKYFYSEISNLLNK
jgi:hypothetical protein